MSPRHASLTDALAIFAATPNLALGGPPERPSEPRTEEPPTVRRPSRFRLRREVEVPAELAVR
jgi:hypothetical protein